MSDTTSLDLLRCLADGAFHSGETLATAGGITRAAVWKRIHQIEGDLGLPVESVRGKGYRLQAPLELLDGELIRSRLGPAGAALLSDLHLFNQIDSTNRFMMERALNQAPSGEACLAERQTAGRGRRGRRWVSPFGANLYLSVLWRFPEGPGRLSGLSLAMGIAAVRALEGLGVGGVGLKWPNDLYWDGRKLGGLLLEVSGEHQGPSRVVAGLGINTRLSAEEGVAIDQPWCVLAEIPGGVDIGRNRLAAAVLDEVLCGLDAFARDGLAPLLGEWRRLDIHYGRPVQVQEGEHWTIGIQRGIDENGALRLETPEGLRTLYSGEVSLRPI